MSLFLLFPSTGLSSPVVQDMKFLVLQAWPEEVPQVGSLVSGEAYLVARQLFDLAAWKHSSHLSFREKILVLSGG